MTFEKMCVYVIRSIAKLMFQLTCVLVGKKYCGAITLLVNPADNTFIALESPFGRLQLPGGYRENGESVCETALRELQEETGITLQREDLDWVCDFEEGSRNMRTSLFIGIGSFESIHGSIEGDVRTLPLSQLNRVLEIRPRLDVIRTFIRKHDDNHPVFGDDSMFQFIHDLAREAGRLAYVNQERAMQTEALKNGALDLVTDLDPIVEAFIRDHIRRRYPDHIIVGEEMSSSDESWKTAEHVWVIDPIDGTLNYGRGLPEWCTMVAYAYNGVLTYSAIAVPAYDSVYLAKSGGGAYRDTKRLSVSPRSLKDDQAVLLPVWGADSNRRNRLVSDMHKWSLETKAVALPYVGSAGIVACRIAEGLYDGTVYPGSRIWDIAPAVLLMREAGAVVENTKNNEWQFGNPGFVAGNAKLIEQIKKAIPLDYLF